MHACRRSQQRVDHPAAGDAPASKSSRPSDAPSARWSAGGNANSAGAPAERSSTAASSPPTGAYRDKAGRPAYIKLEQHCFGCMKEPHGGIASTASAATMHSSTAASLPRMGACYIVASAQNLLGVEVMICGSAAACSQRGACPEPRHPTLAALSLSPTWARGAFCTIMAWYLHQTR